MDLHVSSGHNIFSFFLQISLRDHVHVHGMENLESHEILEFHVPLLDGS